VGTQEGEREGRKQSGNQGHAFYRFTFLLCFPNENPSKGLRTLRLDGERGTVLVCVSSLKMNGRMKWENETNVKCHPSWLSPLRIQMKNFVVIVNSLQLD